MNLIVKSIHLSLEIGRTRVSLRKWLRMKIALIKVWREDLESLNELLIVPFEWQIPIIMYDCHTKQGSHLKIDPTWEEIKSSGFKWDSMCSDVRTFWHKWEICQISAGKLRKCEIVYHIRSNKPLERCQIDLVQFARILTTKPFKYLFSMVNHFSKYAWARWIPDKNIY